MNRTALGVVIAIIVVIGAVLLMNNNATTPTTENQNQVSEPSPTPAPTPAEQPVTDPTVTPTPNPSTVVAKTVEVVMADAGYTPSAITVKKGDTVKFVNNGTKAIWPASAPHPSHTDYPAFDPKKGIAVGESWSFMFDRVGTWRYHDHLNPTRFGSVTVTE